MSASLTPLTLTPSLGCLASWPEYSLFIFRYGKCWEVPCRQVRVRPASRSGGCTPAPRPGSGTASAWRTAGSSRARRGRGRGRPGRPATPAPASRGASHWSLLTGQHHHQHLFSATATLGIFCLQVQAQANKLAVGYYGKVNNMSVRGNTIQDRAPEITVKLVVY